MFTEAELEAVKDMPGLAAAAASAGLAAIAQDDDRLGYTPPQPASRTADLGESSFVRIRREEKELDATDAFEDLDPDAAGSVDPTNLERRESFSLADIAKVRRNSASSCVSMDSSASALQRKLSGQGFTPEEDEEDVLRAGPHAILKLASESGSLHPSRAGSAAGSEAGGDAASPGRRLDQRRPSVGSAASATSASGKFSSVKPAAGERCVSNPNAAMAIEARMCERFAFRMRRVKATRERI